ncbi:MAG: hypothetical protein BWK80_45535 [Desulfobacteraceae bacterium IS3]|nr:MAG: hypothetical protein BWK80_45535 [Desulfobacteraceae bacterium IS3]
MIRINLLPYRAARKKENVRNQILIFFSVAAGVLGILIYFNFYLTGQITALDKKIQETQKEVEKFNKIVEKVEQIKATLALLKKKLDIIKTLKGSSKDAFRLLDTLTNMTVANRMWLTDFEAMEKMPKKGKGKKKKKEGEQEEQISINIKIKGMALDNKTIADFMSRLQEVKDEEEKIFFADVRLVMLKQEFFKQGKDKPNISLKSFEIQCQKALPKKKAETPAPEKGKDEKGKEKAEKKK